MHLLQAELATVIAALAARGDLPEGAEPRLSGSLLTYLDLLQRWNATYNLTAVRAPADMLRLHLADCLAVIGPMRRRLQDIERVEAASAASLDTAAPALASSDATARSLRVLDVGSGGGLPGVVLAVTCPHWQVTCVDTVGKKAAFVQQVAAEMQLKNLRAEHARVESLGKRPFDVITSRAFASLADFATLTRPLLAPFGVWMAMKAKHPHDEIAQLPKDVEVFHVEPVDVPGLDVERCLVWMRPSPAVAA